MCPLISWYSRAEIVMSKLVARENECMFKAECSFSVGVSVTKARAVAGVCNFIVEEGYYEDSEFPVEVDIKEFDQRLYGNDGSVHNIDDEWVRSESTVTVDPEGVRRFAELHRMIEDELEIAEGEDDWRIDYGDDDITYVTRSESGTVVSIDEHWNRAKESRDEANEWDDGEEYWIDEVEGGVEERLSLSSVE